ncbi:hypothetical protein ACFE04_008946 [Oxalis oulophora]
MAEIVVASVMQGLGRLLDENTELPHEARNQIEQFQTELRQLQSYLEDADKRQGEIVRHWESEIRELAFSAEDVIDTFLLNSCRRSDKNVFKMCGCFRETENIQNHNCIGNEIDDIKDKISNLIVKLHDFGITQKSEGGSSSSTLNNRQLGRTYSHCEEDIVVGFEKQMKKLLDKGTKHKVVSIYGMGGTGKTTLARMVYHHHRNVTRHFDAFAWAYLSQRCPVRDIWELLLIKLTSPSEEERDKIPKLEDWIIVKKLYSVMLEKKCLVILDDIWSKDTWDAISLAFPLQEGHSHVMLTTRTRQVAVSVDPSGFHLKLHCLSKQKSWELFKMKALHNDDDPEFLDLGKKMASKCGDLPLAIAALGGLLATKHTLSEWKQVYAQLTRHGQELLGVPDILAVSYHDLPYQLKPCFLYLSIFPQNTDISAKKLIQMWVAEGFLSSVDDKDGETVARSYLQNLADRSMIEVSRALSGGKIRTCRLHDIMRDLCLSITKQVDFFNVIGQAESSISGKARRLAITRKLVEPLINERNLQLRSILFLNRNEIEVTKSKLDSIFKRSKMLRVLNLEVTAPGKIELLPKLAALMLLLCAIPICLCTSKCMAISVLPSRRLKLPSSLGDLRFLQSLNLQAKLDQLVVPNVLWKMEELRYAYFPQVWTSYGKLKLGNLKNLETLVNFRADRCDVKDLVKLINLRKLSMYSKDRLSMRKFSEAIGSSNATLHHLKSLNLKNESKFALEIDACNIISRCPHLSKLRLNGDLEKLPSNHQFSSELTKLTLRNSALKEDPMPTIEKLPNLRVLSLAGASFIGRTMVCSNEGFRQLRTLTFWDLLYLEEWKMDEGAMPRLRSLKIEYCWMLKKLPNGLKSITTLQELEFGRMSAEFCSRVLEGGEDFDKIQHVPHIMMK